MESKYKNLYFNIVLVEPQIPNNTGNIGRLCVASESKLHLIHPLGFEITDSRVKRAGLDYWPDLVIEHHADFDAWYNSVPDKSRVFFFSARSKKSFYETELQKGDYLVFGKEAEGLPELFHQKFAEQMITIPFPGKVRSFNLANAVAMAIGEGIRRFG